MSAEFKFLTKCLGPAELVDQPDWVACAKSLDVDWGVLLEMARKHGVVSSVFVALKPEIQQLPSDCQQSFKREYHTGIGRNVFVAEEFRRVMAIFKTAQIDVIPYKGPMLSNHLFDSPAFRESKDIDLVVHRKDVIRAKQLLLKNGYQSDGDLSEREEVFLFSSRKESSYDLKLPYPSGKGKRLKIELHWKVPLTSNVPPDWYWQHLEWQEFGTLPVRCFTAETLMLILLCHGFRHYWESLKWLSDIDRLIRNTKSFRWDHLLELSSELGVRRVVVFGLVLSRELLGTRLPDDVQVALDADAFVLSLIPGAVENMTGAHRCPVGFRNNILIRERVGDRFLYLKNILDYVFVPDLTDFKRLPLPRLLWPCYWILRPIKVLSCLRNKYGVRSIRRVLFGKTKSA